MTEDEIKEGFVKAMNELMEGKDEIVANIRLIKKTICKTADLEKEKAALEQELMVVSDMMQNLISENARVAQDQEDYRKRYDSLVERYDSAQARLYEITSQIAEREAKAVRLTEFAKALKSRDDIIAVFDERLWGSLVEVVTIERNKKMVFRFRDGTEVHI